MRDVRIAGIVSICILCILALVSNALVEKNQNAQLLKITFLNVGQGDATFIETPSKTQVLVDGGRDMSVLRGLQKQMGFFDRTIDMVIATHPDVDHIGGLIDVFKRYRVKTVLMTENIHDTPVRDAFMKALEKEGSEIIYARSGKEYMLGTGMNGNILLKIFFPDIDPTMLESNMSSIVAQVQYGTIEFLLTGDSPKAIEEYLVEKEENLKSDVLKVGHHGSKTSSADIFVKTVAPTYAIISAGKDNSYGHPHKEVIDTLAQYGVVVYNTAKQGSIKSFSDGLSVWFK